MVEVGKGGGGRAIEVGKGGGGRAIEVDQIGSHMTTNVLFFFSGTIGHVAHGKSTVVKAISGVQTVRFKNELVRNITIKLGYANAKVCLPAS